MCAAFFSEKLPKAYPDPREFAKIFNLIVSQLARVRRKS
jgi:hypothetical protein